MSNEHKNVENIRKKKKRKKNERKTHRVFVASMGQTQSRATCHGESLLRHAWWNTSPQAAGHHLAHQVLPRCSPGAH